MKKINHFRYILSVIVLSCFCLNIQAQTDTAWVLKFKRNGSAFNPGKDDFQPGKKGFYLYENCIYDIVLKNDMVYNAGIVKIKKDSIVFTTHINRQTALMYREFFDTLTVSPAAIKKIRLLGDRIMGLYSNIHLRNYSFELLKDSLAKRMAADTLTDTIYSIRYLIKSYITMQGIDPLYEPIDTSKNKSIIQDEVIPAVIAKQDTILYQRNFIWFLPFNANKVNGISLGVHTGNINGKKILVNGININADMGSMFITMFSAFHFFDAANVKVLSDTLSTDGKISINGLGISGGGIMYGKKLNGLFVNGGICESNTANGIFISGGFNHFQSVKGISVGGIRNTAVKCTGLQIGLINSCKYLKGLQIGFWNVNSKRKMPLINWGT
jgi:hypothetical protein